MKNCPKCQYYLPDGALECPSCRSSIPAMGSALVTPENVRRILDQRINLARHAERKAKLMQGPRDVLQAKIELGVLTDLRDLFYGEAQNQGLERKSST